MSCENYNDKAKKKKEEEYNCFSGIAQLFHKNGEKLAQFLATENFSGQFWKIFNENYRC